MRAGFSIHQICIERVHPPIVARIHDQFPFTIFYVDLGGQAAPVISDANRGRRTTLILDHHHPQKPTDAKVLNLATEFFGLSGDMDISASTAAYFYALELDKANRDLAHVAVLGAVGDEHDREGRLVKEDIAMRCRTPSSKARCEWRSTSRERKSTHSPDLETRSRWRRWRSR